MERETSEKGPMEGLQKEAFPTLPLFPTLVLLSQCKDCSVLNQQFFVGSHARVPDFKSTVEEP